MFIVLALLIFKKKSHFLYFYSTAGSSLNLSKTTFLTAFFKITGKKKTMFKKKKKNYYSLKGFNACRICTLHAFLVNIASLK